MEATTHKNPFLHPYDTPHDTVPFDKITLADYEEAMMEGIRREKEELEIVINDPAEPTFENTLDRDDDPEDNKHYYDLLGRTTSVFYNMLSAETNDDMDELAQKMSPILTKHGNDISLNEKMFKRVKAVYDSTPRRGRQAATSPVDRRSQPALTAILAEPSQGKEGIFTPYNRRGTTRRASRQLHSRCTRGG